MACAPELKLCQQAAALIEKYRLFPDGKLTSVQCHETCVDPTNRDGKFANFEDILKCGEDVAGIGHSKMYSRAIVTQLPVDPVARDAVIRFQQDKHGVDARIPAVQSSRVGYSGSAGNTMFLFHACVCAQTAAPGSFLANEVGKLSEARMKEVSPSFCTAIAEGVPAIILRREIRTEEPDGLRIIQAAENAKGSVQRLDHEIAIMVRTGQIVSDTSIFSRLGLDGIVGMIKDQVPHLASDVQGIAHWVLVQGGHKAPHVPWLAAQHEAHIPSNRRLKGTMWEALATVIPPYLPVARRAATFMCFACPKSMLSRNFCEWMTVAELKTIVGTAGWVATARAVEEQLVLVHQTFENGCNSDIPIKAYQAIMGRCENRVARFLFKKKVDGLRNFECATAIIDECLKEVEATTCQLSSRGICSTAPSRMHIMY